MVSHEHSRTKCLAPSKLQLPPGPWVTVLDGLCARFPAIPRDAWANRFERGKVQDASGQPLRADMAYQVGMEIRYYREVDNEPAIPFDESVLHMDAHLLVIDKPHFLPVTPAGRYIRETLLARLVDKFENRNIVPLHRIDRETAGLVMFSINSETRDAYQALFRHRNISKHYEALATPLPDITFPLVYRSRMEKGEPFFRMKEVSGEPNSETHIDVVERGRDRWRYALSPVTGRKHQLRVHMSQLGAPIENDFTYPNLMGVPNEDFTRPLRLLAKRLEFIDPVTGQGRVFESRLRLPDFDES